MFRDLVSPRSSAAAQLEAVTSERDFFKEKYAAHASEMEALKAQLKESQRMVDKLRRQVLELTAEKRGNDRVASSNSNPSLAEMSGNSSGGGEGNTDNETDLQQPQQDSDDQVADEVVATPSTKKNHVTTLDENSEKENNAKNDEVYSDEEAEDESECESDDDDSHDNDEAEAIRLKAERMLAWASYQHSSRRTPSTPEVDNENDDDEHVLETPNQSAATNRGSAAYSLPAKIQGLLSDDEESDSSSFVQQPASDSKQPMKNGRIGKFVSNLKDMIATQSESESCSEDESVSSDSECSNLSENLARMQLDVQM